MSAFPPELPAALVAEALAAPVLLAKDEGTDDAEDNNALADEITELMEDAPALAVLTSSFVETERDEVTGEDIDATALDTGPEVPPTGPPEGVTLDETAAAPLLNSCKVSLDCKSVTVN